MTKQSTALTNRNSDKFMLRLPDGMRDAIAEFAKQSGRSMNAEIVYRLQKSIEEDQAETGGIQQMEFRIVDPSIGKGPQKIFNALEEMERILTGTLKMLEEAEHDEDGENHKG